MIKVYLGLVTKLGNREANIRKAIDLINRRVGQVVRQSSFIETEPWGFKSENRFLNAVILCETTKAPREVLQLTQQIERDMGRTKKSVNSKLKTQSPHYSDRPIDIDILLYDDITVDEPDLHIPHPLMQQRDFVMIPLREIMDSE